MIAFYAFGIIDLQDMFPLIVESVKQGKKCWVCFFDCTEIKRQFYYYTDEELNHLFSEHKGSVTVDIFRIPDRHKYNKKFNSIKDQIEAVFIQNLNPKKAIWYPEIGDKKVIHLAFWTEAKHLENSRVGNIQFSVLKREEDREHYKKFNNIKYFGDLRLENYKFLQKSPPKQKTCFIPETYLRISKMTQSDLKQEIDFYHRLFDTLHTEGYSIIWKKREKGYPNPKSASPLDFCTKQPDQIIEKDLFLPSSIFKFSYNADLCIVVNDSLAYFDLIRANSNAIILATSNVREHKMEEFFKHHEILDMTCEEGWEKFKERTSMKNEKEVSPLPIASTILKTAGL